MFDRIRQALRIASRDPSLSAWAELHGLQAQGRLEDAQFALERNAGPGAALPWRVERGPPSRDFIRTSELRGRSERGAPEDLAVMVINRPLKEVLEARAYAEATDSMQTTVDSALNEEVRWLAMYDEVRWSGGPHTLWPAYAVVTEQRDAAEQWLGGPLVAHALLARAATPARSEVPFVLVLLRGRVYLREEFTPATLETLALSTSVFATACQAAAALTTGAFTSPG